MSLLSETLDLALNFSFFFFGLAIILSFTRIILGPLTPDRVIALEMISVFVVGIILLYAMESNQWILLDVAMIVALISFLGAVTFAFFIEKRGAS